MSTGATIPTTIPAEFVDRTVCVGAEIGYYRLELGGVVSFDGKLDEARLRRAVRLLLDAEPVLGCRFVSDAVPPVFERLHNLDAMQLLDVCDSEDPVSDAAAFIAEPFDPERDPQVRALLVRGSASDMLALRVGHLAADGGAVKEMLYLLGEIYRTLAAQPDFIPEPNIDGVRAPIAKAGLIERLGSLSGSDQKTPPSDSEWYVPTLGGRGPASYVSTTVEPETFRSALNLAKAEGATANDVILTALYRTLYRLSGVTPGSKTPLMFTCELRKHLPAGTKTAVANISSATWITVPPAGPEGFNSTLGRVVEATQAWKRSGAGKSNAMGIPIIHKMTRKKGLASIRKMMAPKEDMDPTRGAIVLTNIGVIDTDRLDFGAETPVADSWLLAPVSPVGAGLAASTYRDRLHLTAGVEFASMSESVVSGVLEETANEIVEWVGSRIPAAQQEDQPDSLRSQVIL
jgi:NRPS condensation-like uncharacterized protein